MRLVAAGDMGAFSVLIRRHQQAVRTLAYRVIGRVDAADDICQDTFLHVLRGARSYQPAAAFTTWLHRIVVNLCLDCAKRPKLAMLNEDRPVDAGTPDAPLRREEQAAAVQREIARTRLSRAW